MVVIRRALSGLAEIAGDRLLYRNDAGPGRFERSGTPAAGLPQGHRAVRSTWACGPARAVGVLPGQVLRQDFQSGEDGGDRAVLNPRGAVEISARPTFEGVDIREVSSRTTHPYRRPVESRRTSARVEWILLIACEPR